MKTAGLDLNVEILGVNATSEAAYNGLIRSSLPWLQDTTQASVWSSWNVGYRDVRILDGQNRLRGIYNLTLHDLSSAANRTALKNLFVGFAKATDSDADGLSDDWELLYFKDLDAQPGDDPDQDGRDNATEYALGTNPTIADVTPLLRPHLSVSQGHSYLTLRLHRRAGSVLNYLIESSTDLKQWSSVDIAPGAAASVLFDGTGVSEIEYSLARPVTDQPAGYLRVTASPRPKP